MDVPSSSPLTDVIGPFWFTSPTHIFGQIKYFCHTDGDRVDFLSYRGERLCLGRAKGIAGERATQSFFVQKTTATATTDGNERLHTLGQLQSRR